MQRSKVTIMSIHDKKAKGEKVTMLTAYDFYTAAMIDQAEVDMILVGDSVGNVVLGYDSTVPVTMEEMIHHCKAVRRGTQYAFLIGDLPFMSYNISHEEAVRNAGRLIKEAGCDSVKLEGGSEMASVVKVIVDAGIPVCGHIGLTPQTATKLSGFRVQGKDAEGARQLIESAKALDEAGAFALVLELVPDAIAAEITKNISIPTIGIGAGPDCDGQVLVTNDMLGLYEKFIPKFVKQYVNLAPMIKKAMSDYVQEVKSGDFPGPEHTFHVK
ncbi:MAG: 3-methyl-2-oxobutanoate hydroxymethyltransferase [Deltaproteobacteria bacterium]|nr:3-methyl-2-oxobutanoate hydroxymethyltransferase [Deltaproteobacteria bacterium]